MNTTTLSIANETIDPSSVFSPGCSQSQEGLNDRITEVNVNYEHFKGQYENFLKKANKIDSLSQTCENLKVQIDDLKKIDNLSDSNFRRIDPWES